MGVSFLDLGNQRMIAGLLSTLIFELLFFYLNYVLYLRHLSNPYLYSYNPLGPRYLFASIFTFLIGLTPFAAVVLQEKYQRGGRALSVPLVATTGVLVLTAVSRGPAQDKVGFYATALIAVVYLVNAGILAYK